MSQAPLSSKTVAAEATEKRISPDRPCRSSGPLFPDSLRGGPRSPLRSRSGTGTRGFGLGAVSRVHVAFRLPFSRRRHVLEFGVGEWLRHCGGGRPVSSLRFILRYRLSLFSSSGRARNGRVFSSPVYTETERKPQRRPRDALRQPSRAQRAPHLGPFQFSWRTAPQESHIGLPEASGFWTTFNCKVTARLSTTSS